ncbi:jg21793 [Pararge aegeria aegeria]|uniref:Jg21793 protein n=1 Tax=Pararge aegeria aegeria TaxID=348720 RepID=A0A8S4R0J6_9NEOP|nr:jg21793 [Pararge aegeria aegeria]
MIDVPHTLNLIASTDFKQARIKNIFFLKLYDTALSKCQALWNLCARSPKACETYLQITGKSPTSPCATRWNSYYNTMQDLLAVQNHLNEAMKILKLPPLKENKFHFLREYVQSQYIAEDIQSLQVEEHTYYGCLLPDFYRIQHVIENPQNKKSEILQPSARCNRIKLR